MNLFGDARVSDASAGLPTSTDVQPASGDLAVPSTDAQATPTEQTPAQDDVQQQINRLRSIKDQEVAQARREAQELAARVAEYEQQQQLTQAVGEWEAYYTQQYPTLDAQSIRTAAENAVRQQYEQYQAQSEVDELRTFKQSFEQRQQQVEQGRAVARQLMADVTQTFPTLTPQEIADATKGVVRTDPNFQSRVWAAAAQLHEQKMSGGAQTYSNQQLIRSTPFPGRGGSTAGAQVAFALPDGVKRGSAAHMAWVEQQERIRRGEV
jgi:hypothetical protein